MYDEKIFFENFSHWNDHLLKFLIEIIIKWKVLIVIIIYIINYRYLKIILIELTYFFYYLFTNLFIILYYC